MQDDVGKKAPLNYDKDFVSFCVVSGAILMLIVIIVYLHFDAKITKFFEDAGAYISKLKKAMRAKIRYFSHFN